MSADITKPWLDLGPTIDPAQVVVHHERQTEGFAIW